MLSSFYILFGAIELVFLFFGPSNMKQVTEHFQYLQKELKAIQSATNNFADDNYIGRGGFGKVYKGELVHSNGCSMVAIKRLDPEFGQGNPEFWKEIIMLSRYKHQNIVSLLGFCDESGEKILVYEYASKRSLDLYLNNHDLTWSQRLMICIGAARGLMYLHSPGENHERVLHRDIKSSNILLDENWNARISDFGLSKFGPANQQITFLFSNCAGTIGYFDPEYLQSGLLTKESDVYSFGVVLFEVLCGRLSIVRNNNNCRPLAGLAQECYEQNKLNEIIHVSIKDEINSNSLKAFTRIAYQCLKRHPKERPLMTEVVSILEHSLEHQHANSPDSIDEYIAAGPSMQALTATTGAGFPLLDGSIRRQVREFNQLVLGDNLYSQVEEQVPLQAARQVTGKFLELDALKAVGLVESPEDLKPRVTELEAMKMLPNVSPLQQRVTKEHLSITGIITSLATTLGYQYVLHEVQLGLVGIQNAGKTSVANVVTTGEFSEKVTSAVGINLRKVTKGNTEIKIWDLGGQPRFRPIWERYCHQSSAIVYVVDAADEDESLVSKSELDDLLTKPSLNGIPLLVLGNKIDKVGALTKEAFTKKMGLSSITSREVCCFMISCKNSQNIDSVIEWLLRHPKQKS